MDALPVFLSYCREDLPRAQIVIDALAAEGMDVWWDQHIRTGSAWRIETERRLKAARAVVVLWTRASVASEWVLEEADSGRQRGILCPVRLEPVDQPIGFGSTQACDLSRWKGDRHDPQWRHFVASLSAILDAPVPEPPRSRRSRVAVAAIVAGVVAALLLLMSPLGLGWFGGAAATLAEKSEWKQIRASRECAPLDRYLVERPDGPFAAEAKRLVERRRTGSSERLESFSQPLPGFGISSPNAAGSRAAACASAEAVVRGSTAENCALLATGEHREVRPVVGKLACKCREATGLWQCEAKGPARCEGRRLTKTTTEICDG